MLSSVDRKTTEGGAAYRTKWLETERAEKVPEMLARRILRDIVQRNLVPGDQLPAEATMLASFGVGRTSLREALRILEMYGLIRIKPGPHGGPVVADLQAKDYGHATTFFLQRARATFRELLEARTVMEPTMASLAAMRLTTETAERLKAATELGWDAVDAPPEVWSRTAEAFHSVVAGASGNGVLDLQSAALVSIERQHLGPVMTDPAERRRVLRVHDRIAEAILNQDAALAEKLSRKHMLALIKVWEQVVPRQLAEFIEW
jgi:DNA-binding FadR family transcriptional regulator